MQGALRVKHEGSAVDQKGYMAFYTNDGTDDRVPTERMRIASDGKVGVNCTNSGYQLEVRGASTHSDIIAWSNTGGALAGRLESYDNEAGCVRVYGANKAGTANQSQHVLNARDGSNGEVSFNVNKHNCDFRYSSENETDMFFIDASAGKIGINESAPDALISTKGTLTTQLSGTVTATNGSTTIEGSGTDFKAELEWGSSIKILSEIFTVVSITDDDTLTIDSAYAGSTAGSLAAFTDPPAFNFRTGDDKTLFKVLSTQSFHLGADDDNGLKLGNTIFPNDDNVQKENTGYGVKIGANTTGTANVLFGQSVMANTGASDSNVCFGRMIMTSGGESDNNTIMGSAAGTPISGGNDNSLFGFQAGNSITSGDQNVSLGSGSDCAATAGNQIAIGYGSVTDGANKIRLGNSSIATCNIQVDWTVDSDERIKENIQDADAGLDFINALRPVSFTRKHPAEWPEEIRERRYKQGAKKIDSNGVETFVSSSTFDVDTQQPIKDEFDSTSRVDGLIAQEVKDAVESLGVAFHGVDEAENGKMGIQYATLVVPLIKAVQTLSAKVKALEEQGN